MLSSTRPCAGQVHIGMGPVRGRTEMRCASLLEQLFTVVYLRHVSTSSVGGAAAATTYLFELEVKL
jgi:hypothetical protein